MPMSRRTWVGYLPCGRVVHGQGVDGPGQLEVRVRQPAQLVRVQHHLHLPVPGQLHVRVVPVRLGLRAGEVEEVHGGLEVSRLEAAAQVPVLIQRPQRQTSEALILLMHVERHDTISYSLTQGSQVLSLFATTNNK